ncbi:MAG TPA: TonB-dependent receptor [Bryobacteraceae bacterium]
METQRNTRRSSAPAAIAALLLAFFIGRQTASAQATTGDILGTVTDGSGASVAGAKVVIENLGTHETRSAQTGAAGEFVFTLLSTGHYSVNVDATGFKHFSVGDLTLGSGDRARVTALMQIGQQSQTVEVTAQPPALQADSSTLSDTLAEKSVQDLPVNGRNVTRLVQLTAGANEGLPGGLGSGTRPDDRRQTSSVSVNGQSDAMNNNIIDGMDNNERIIGTIGVKPSIDGISEVRVQTNEYTAESGRTAGGVINVITKSGTNQYHGSAYEFFRNDVLDSRSFFSTIGAKPEYRQNQFGGSMGGPIKKNKTFFFADFEEFRAVQGVTTITTVPTAAEHTGNFSAITSQLTNPNGVPLAGNIIPTSQISPIAANYMSLYPLPNQNLTGTANNYEGTFGRTQFSHTADGRLDHHFNDNNLFFARYTINDVATFTPPVFPAVNGVQPGGVSYDGPSQEWAQNAQMDYVHIFNAKALLELKAGYTRVNIASNPINPLGQNLSAKFGLTGVNVSEPTSQLAPFYVSGFATLGDTPYLPLIYVDNTFQYNGTFSYTAGAHSIKVGAALIRRQAEAFSSSAPVGRFTFQSAPTGNAVASLLFGIPFSTQRVLELTAPYYQTWEPSVYIQDDWRATRWLTVNLGARYDVFTPFTERHSGLSNFDPTTGQIIVAGQNGVSATAGVKTDYSNLAPRVGFAATMGQGFVLRGGYGITYFPGNITSAAYLNNPPFTYAYGPVSNRPLSAGLPVITTPSITNPIGSLYAEDKNFRTSYLHQFNLNLQKQLGANVLSVAYVGELGRHLAQLIPNIDLPQASPLPNPASREPFAAVAPNVSLIGYLQSQGTSSYNALQVSFQRRFTKGLTVNSNYTWAHGIDDASTFSNGYAAGVYLNPYTIGTYDRGNSDLDIRHRFVASVNYELPFGKSLQGPMKQLFHGWQINSIAVWQTGLPFTITDSNPQANLGPSVSSDRPNVVASSSVSNQNLAHWFNTSAYAPQTFGTLGDVGRNTLYGPPQRRIDLSLFKNFQIREFGTLQFRAESYNLTNTPSFANPNSTLGNPAFGTISSINAASNPRQIQFALKLQF